MRSKLHFTKYQGTGNDFVVIDDRASEFDIEDVDLIAKMCDRRFGIGADGLILLRNIEDYDFEMIYFNSDGRQSSMCGNGGRCIVHFAHSLGVFERQCRFLAIDGDHEGEMSDDGIVKLKMGDVSGTVLVDAKTMTMDTGSPHYVTIVADAMSHNVVESGRAIRYSDAYKVEGINVNFISEANGALQVTTYERGVEDQTLSCGTGVTAAAIAASQFYQGQLQSPVDIHTKGGELKVYFKTVESGYSGIWLEGPAVAVFSGLYSES